MRYGRARDAAVTRSLRRMVADLAATPQGLAWPCLPDPVTGFRGPGRKADFCPQVTLEALRTWARLPPSEQPEQALDVARTAVRAWRVRAVDLAGQPTAWSSTRFSFEREWPEVAQAVWPVGPLTPPDTPAVVSDRPQERFSCSTQFQSPLAAVPSP